MRPFTVLPIAAALATSVNALGALDFISELVTVIENTVTFDTGTYVIQNVKSGKNLYFARDSTVGTYIGDSTVGVNLETVKYSDPSGKDITGLVISGTTSDTMKCLAAQWNFAQDGTPSRNQYAVPYACQLGSNGNGQNNADTDKGLWVANEVACPGSSSSGSGVSVGVNLNVKDAAVKASSSAANVDFSSSDDSSADAATTTAAPTATSTDAAWSPTTTQSVDVHDQSTWVCQHPGWWLYAHQGYVTEAGHVECKDDLAAYAATQRRLVRRTREDRHAEIARHSNAKRASKCYTITPTNHLADMATLGLTGSANTGFANTPSLNLAAADPTDPNQLWTITSA